jgi:aminoglycoside phosphotransferase (APT) family kinase protein
MQLNWPGWGRNGPGRSRPAWPARWLPLHAVDPASAGLAGFGKADGFLRGQVGRWKKQPDAPYSRDLPAAGELHAVWLRTSLLSRQPAVGIVHGDYRRDNVLVDDQDRLAAVLDREMATLGDPLTDLALMLACDRLGSVLPGHGRC